MTQQFNHSEMQAFYKTKIKIIKTFKQSKTTPYFSCELQRHRKQAHTHTHKDRYRDWRTCGTWKRPFSLTPWVQQYRDNINWSFAHLIVGSMSRNKTKRLDIAVGRAKHKNLVKPPMEVGMYVLCMEWPKANCMWG